MPWVVEFGGQPDLGPGHARCLDAVTDLLLVSVGECGVDVSVTCPEGCLDGVLDLVGLRLPCSEAQGGDLGTRVEGVGLAGGMSVTGNGNRRLEWELQGDEELTWCS